MHESVKDMCLDRVPADMIRDMQHSQDVRISIRDTSSKNGRGNLFVPKSQVRPAIDKQTGVPIPGLMDVSLGSLSSEVKYSVRSEKGGSIPVHKSASEIVDLWREDRKAYAEEQRRKSIEKSKSQRQQFCEATFYPDGRMASEATFLP